MWKCLTLWANGIFTFSFIFFFNWFFTPPFIDWHNMYIDSDEAISSVMNKIWLSQKPTLDHERYCCCISYGLILWIHHTVVCHSVLNNSSILNIGPSALPIHIQTTFLFSISICVELINNFGKKNVWQCHWIIIICIQIKPKWTPKDENNKQTKKLKKKKSEKKNSVHPKTSNSVFDNRLGYFFLPHLCREGGQVPFVMPHFLWNIQTEYRCCVENNILGRCVCVYVKNCAYLLRLSFD